MITKTRRLNAVVLRIILSVSLLIVAAVVIAGFASAHQMLTDYAVSVGKKNVDAQSSDTTLQALTESERQLTDNTENRANADKLRLSDIHPEFTVRDMLTRIAKDNNISIGITSNNSTDNNSSGQAPPQSQPSVSGTNAVPTPATSSAGNTFKLTVSVKPSNASSFNRNNYKNFLQFLHDLEQNLPKIKIGGVSVSGGGGSTSGDSANNGQPGTSSSGGDTISIGSIDLEIYIK